MGVLIVHSLNSLGLSVGDGSGHEGVQEHIVCCVLSSSY